MSETEYPSLDLAYEWVGPSYSWTMERINANRARVQHIQTFAATIMFAAPLLLQSVAEPGTDEWLFIGAVVSFLLTFWLGIRATSRGEIDLPNMVAIRKNLTWREPVYFKGSMVLSAANASRTNRDLLSRVARLADFMTFGVIVEIFYLIAWALL